MIVSSSSASVVVSPANVDAVAAAAVGKLMTFVSRLSREEKKKELAPDASRMSEKKHQRKYIFASRLCLFRPRAVMDICQASKGIPNTRLSQNKTINCSYTGLNLGKYLNPS